MEKKTKIILGVIGIIIFILVVAFTEIIKRDYKPNYLTRIKCKEQPYEDIEYYYEKEPYQTNEYYYEREPYKDTEYYWGREPYTTSERYCSDRSWWSGDCVSWSYRTITKYRDVRKSRTITKYRDVRKSRRVTKYRDVQKSRTITKFKEVCVRIYFWKSVDYSENWLNYKEIYDRQGNRIYNVVA